MLFSPQRETSTGRPKMTKLERMMPCTSTPRRRFSFSSRGTKIMHSANSAMTKQTAVRSRGPLKAVERSVEMTWKSRIGRNTRKTMLFIFLNVASSPSLSRRMQYPSAIIRNRGMTTLKAKARFSIDAVLSAENSRDSIPHPA